MESLLIAHVLFFGLGVKYATLNTGLEGKISYQRLSRLSFQFSTEGNIPTNVDVAEEKFELIENMLKACKV